MPRFARRTHVDVFATSPHFDAQLYRALQQSPWWMISIAFHVLVFVIASTLVQHRPAPRSLPSMAIHSQAATPEEDVVPVEPPTRPIHPSEIVQPMPVVPDPLPPEEIRIDNDLPFDETFGEDGISDDPFTAPGTNGIIGLGPNAGGAFRGRGHDRDRPGGPGGPPGQVAVEEALKWLAAHQSPDGAWEAAGFNRWCDGKALSEGPDGLGKALYDPGVTGLALCAFLGAGYTSRGKHPFAKVVARGLRYLKNVQDAEGCFGPRTSQHFIYNHATAALAMVEAYGMTESPVFKGAAQKALDFIALSRNPYFAWRYGVKAGDNDTSVTGWMMMALKSAKLINQDCQERGKPAALLIDEEAFAGIRAWVDKMTDPDHGRTGYIQRGGAPARPQELIDEFPGDKSESMTGVGLLARIFTGEDPRRSEVIRKGVRLCVARLPTWNPNDGSIDMYYWYYATLAMYQVGGKEWEAWNGALKAAVADSQRRDTDACLYRGSWDPIDPWGSDGGRVYSTALLAMCLEVHYRYARVIGTN